MYREILVSVFDAKTRFSRPTKTEHVQSSMSENVFLLNVKRNTCICISPETRIVSGLSFPEQPRLHGVSNSTSCTWALFSCNFPLVKLLQKRITCSCVALIVTDLHTFVREDKTALRPKLLKSMS